MLRYVAELFYMAPLYHLAFTSLTNMIVIDATDLEFHESLQLLQEEMDKVIHTKSQNIRLKRASFR